ncbi:fumarylacetoacetase [Apiospora rasikravindrae]|uniref:Fumarylacetoacetase n=1 Tax=Apiospora rasikravindrae TaxID=990691 RepID=A0ABR1SLI6_9PEZI
MKYRRVNGARMRIPGPGDYSETNPELAPVQDVMLRHVIKHYKPDQHDALKRNLPFEPQSYRDFMLFPAHYTEAAAGIFALTLQQYPFPLSFLRFVVDFLAFFWTLYMGTVFPPFRPSGLYLKQPIFYQSNHKSIVASGAPVTCPGYCTRYLDVELELGFVLGRSLYNATDPNEALSAIAGFVVLNDFSARDVQWAEMRSGLGPQLCKSFASSMSSVVVSADEVLPKLPNLRGRVRINDRIVARCAVGAKDWQFTLGEALMHASRGTRLYEGEFFGSGTLPGGAGIENMAFKVEVGDTVTLEIDGIGDVTNDIVAEEKKG